MDKQATGRRSPDQHGLAGLKNDQTSSGRSGRRGRRPVRRAAALGLALATGLGAILLLNDRLAPTGGIAKRLARIAPLPQAPAALAQAALDQAPRDLPSARAWTLRELDIAPSHAEAWLRLAFVESALSGGRLTPAANAALKQAYVLAPIDSKFATWRLQFILERWSSADPAIRAYAMDEIGVLWRETSFRRSMRSLLLNMVDPAGQMALSLRVQALERRAPLRILTP